MGAHSAIEWTDHTFNAWVGCTKLSAACDHCYAEGWAKRTGHPELWSGSRRRTSDANWRQPINWNVAAPKTGKRRVFCCSLADVFDNQVNPQWRGDLFDLIRKTSNLEWQLLTKRPQNIIKMCEAAGGLPGNAAIGTTVEDQEQAGIRVPALLSAIAIVKPRYAFLSCEPLLGPLDLMMVRSGEKVFDALQGAWAWRRDGDLEHGGACARIDWVICGGESGPKARPMHPAWARALRDQCDMHGVPFFYKQWGEWRHAPDRAHFKELLREPWTRLSSGLDGVRPALMVREGKKAAGRLLDGVAHSQYPETSA